MKERIFSDEELTILEQLDIKGGASDKTEDVYGIGCVMHKNCTTNLRCVN